MLKRCQSKTLGHNSRFNKPLNSLGASTIDLCLSVFPWADFRTTKGAIKLHVGLSHYEYLPVFVSLTDGKCADVTAYVRLTFPKEVLW